MLRPAQALFILVFLGGCDFAVTQEQKIKKEVMLRLNDPDSAKFRNIVKGKTENHYCGQVNAKNRMGGYAGYKSFIFKIIKDDEYSVIFLEEAPTDSEYASVKRSNGIEEVMIKCDSIVEYKENCSDDITVPEMCELMKSDIKKFVKEIFKRY